MKKVQVVTLIASLLIPLMVGVISALLTAKGMAAYGGMDKPPLSPPAWVFSVAWTVLYLMMGLASYFVVVEEGDKHMQTSAILLYGIQLIMNFMWSIIFFNWGMYLLAFIWLMVMWCLVILCAFRFFSVSRVAAYLMIPYILWLTFAAYLNLGSYLLSIRKK